MYHETQITSVGVLDCHGTRALDICPVLAAEHLTVHTDTRDYHITPDCDQPPVALQDSIVPRRLQGSVVKNKQLPHSAEKGSSSFTESNGPLWTSVRAIDFFNLVN